MAVIKEYVAVPDTLDIFAGAVTTHGRTFFDIDHRSAQSHWIGSGFTYDAQNFVLSGFVKGMTLKIAGTVALSITGLYASIPELADSPNPDRTLFLRNDTFIGLSGARDTIDLGEGYDTYWLCGGDDSIRDTGYESDRISGGAGNDRLNGGMGNDLVQGDGGNDILYGSQGEDVLRGGSGTDRMWGGFAEHDIFDFDRASDSRPGAARDVIYDFDTQDQIDLSTIDANGSNPGNGRFIFVNSAPFSGVAGELRFFHEILSGDINGDRIADFEIRLVSFQYYTPEIIL